MNYKKMTSLLLAGAMTASLFCSMTVNAQEPVTVTGVFGDEEIEVTFDKAPERVASLAGWGHSLGLWFLL